MGVIIWAMLIIHINSPIYITDPAEALSIEQLPDGRLLASLREDVAGYDIDKASEESGDNYEIRVSCYKTKIHNYLNRKNDSLILLGEKDNIDAIYYYPTEGDDKLLYSSGETSEFSGTITLPRLVYNYWIVIGLALTIAGLIAWYICRKKYYANMLLKLTALPLAFVVSAIMCLAGRFNEVYNAQFYFSGITLLAIAIYLLLIILIEKRNSIKKSEKRPR